LTIKKITVPDLGEASEVEVIELLVNVGEKVKKNDSLLVLESDKAAMEIPAPFSGTVKEISINLGDQVTAGSDILTLEIDSEKEDSPSSIGADESESKNHKESEHKQEDNYDHKSDASKDGVEEVFIEVPDLGTEDEVDVIEVHVQVSDQLGIDDVLITLESDKAAMEVPSPNSGVLKELLVKVGDKVKTGSKIAIIEQLIAIDNEISVQGVTEADDPAKGLSLEEANSGTELDARPSEIQVSTTTKEETILPSSMSHVYAGPAVRKLARELGVDLTLIQGSGAKNRIVKDDINAFVKESLNRSNPSASSNMMDADLDFSKFGEVEERKRSKLEKITAINMARNWASVPHVAQFNEADVTDLDKFLSEIKEEAENKQLKVTYLPFLLKACAKALKEYPQFNVSLHSSGEYVIQKKYLHIGVAVATHAGLVVPVIRNVDQKSIWDLASEVMELSSKAEERKLVMRDMQGACFSISSLGALGGKGFIPIVNSPEVGILGVAKTEIKPVFTDGEFRPRSMLPFTLSYDHRAVNGVDGGLFATYLAKLLSDVRHLIL
tara:strand:- start:2373 stop:4031 length:1659 start_codon:yes stop_codon:yes gene_type:complete